MINASVVLYNSDIEQVKTLLDAICNCGDVGNVYLVDNSPSDYLCDLENYHHKISYIKNTKNIGYGSAHNIAIRKTINAGIEYHLVVNPDVELDSEILSELETFMDNNCDIANVMPKVLYPDKTIQNLCKLYPTPLNLFLRRFPLFKTYLQKLNWVYEMQFLNFDEVQEIPMLSGCFMFLRTKSLERITFDENIFMYMEDFDLCRRLSVEGGKTVLYPQVSIIHHYEKASYKKLKLLMIHIKSAIYYFNKWGWWHDDQRKIVNQKYMKYIKKGD